MPDLKDEFHLLRDRLQNSRKARTIRIQETDGCARRTAGRSEDRIRRAGVLFNFARCGRPVISSSRHSPPILTRQQEGTRGSPSTRPMFETEEERGGLGRRPISACRAGKRRSRRANAGSWPKAQQENRPAWRAFWHYFRRRAPAQVVGVAAQRTRSLADQAVGDFARRAQCDRG